MLTIGVAIPCYRGHFHYINSLLPTLAESTLRPEKIVVSCSGWDKTGTLQFVCDGIPVDILFTTTILDAAANRNRAARALSTDVIAFLDADDRMHPNRLELLHEAFTTLPCEAVYHGCHRLRRDQMPDVHPDAGPLHVTTRDASVHAGHVAVRSRLIARIQFDERPEAWRQEDTLYKRSLEASGVPIVYLSNQLTYYLYLGNP